MAATRARAWIGDPENPKIPDIPKGRYRGRSDQVERHWSRDELILLINGEIMEEKTKILTSLETEKKDKRARRDAACQHCTKLMIGVGMFFYFLVTLILLCK